MESSQAKKDQNSLYVKYMSISSEDKMDPVDRRLVQLRKMRFLRKKGKTEKGAHKESKVCVRECRQKASMGYVS